MNIIPTYNLKSFKTIKRLGEGSFGDAYLVQHIFTSIKYVTKVTRNEIQPNETNNAFFQELLTYSKTINPSILPIYGYSLYDINGNSYPSILLEYMKNGSLEQILRNKTKKDNLFKKSNQTKRYIILLGVALGMKYLHSQGIIHRDFKTGNILLDDNFYPRICDFGLSVVSDLPLSQFEMDDCVGTPLYMAPEIFSEENYTYQVDVYAFSLVAYEILTGIAPFQGYRTKRALVKDVKNGKRPDLTIIGDKEIRNFIQRCWSQKPCDRPKFSEIVEEIMTDKYKKFFHINNNEVLAYLNFFDENLRNPLLCQQLNLKKSADGGNANSMYFYGLLLSYQKKEEESKKYIRKAADRGNEKAMGFCYNEMKRRIKNQEHSKDSINDLMKLAKKGNHMAMLEYGLILLKSDKFQAANYFKLALAKGNVFARELYSSMLFKGDGIMCNKREAASHYKFLAEHGFRKSMLIYGMMLYFGDGVKINKKAAAYYIKMAADKQSSISIFLYGYMLFNGDGIKEDIEKAGEYITESFFSGCIYSLFFYVLLKYNENKNDPNQSQMINLFQLDEVYKFNSTSQKRSFEINKSLTDMSFTELFKPIMDLVVTDLDHQNMSFLDRLIREIIFFESSYCSFNRFIFENINKNDAVLFLKRMANKGNSDAMLLYGLMLLKDEDLTIGKNEISIFLKNAADKGNKYATIFYNFIQLCENKHAQNECYDTNLMILFALIEIYTDKNKRGMKCLKNLAEKGDMNSMFVYGTFLNDKNDKKKAIHFYKKAAKKGHENAMLLYASMINKDVGTEINKKEAIKYFKKLIDKGNTTAMLCYGRMLLTGEGIERNEEEAVKYFKQSANLGNANGMFYYGKMLLIGIGIKKNEKEAEKYFIKSANLGLVDSMYMYAIMQYRGIGVQKNYDKAARYFKMAADKNDKESMYYYGNILYKGKGVLVNKSEAIEYYRKSSVSGYIKSMSKYGRMLLSGKEVEINKEEGIDYLKKASEKGNIKAMFKYSLLLLKGDASEYDIFDDKKKALYYIFKSSWLYFEDKFWFVEMILLIILLLIVLYFFITKMLSLL